MRKEIETLELIRKAMRDSGQKIINENPFLKRSQDLRILTFSKASEVATSARLGLVFMNTFKEDPVLMRNHPALKNDIDQNPFRLMEFERFIKASYIQSFFSIQESALRTLLRELDSISCKKGTAEFKSIYEKLFKIIGLNDSSKKDYIKVLDFWREIRNLVHNNFIYFSRNEESPEFQYRNQVYVFKHGKPADFLTWKVLLLLTCDSGGMFESIFNLECIKKIPQIIDPANMETARP